MVEIRKAGFIDLVTRNMVSVPGAFMISDQRTVYICNKDRLAIRWSCIASCNYSVLRDLLSLDTCTIL